MNNKMKKIGLYTMALLSLGLVACNQDFETEFVPQTNAQESLLQMSDVSVSATVPSTIKLSDYIDEEAGTDKNIAIGTVSVKESAMPANTILKAFVEFSKTEDFAESITLDANSLDGSSEISVKASDLQDAYFNNITRNPAETPLYIRTVLHTVTAGADEAIVGKPGENFFAKSNVTFTPLKKVQIAPAYYVIGAKAGWSPDGARTQQFAHSSKDVYEDPIFTITVETGGDDCWFAIADDTALDAISNENDWSQLYGTKGEASDLSGKMDRRSILGGEHTFHITGAKKLRITLDMMEYSYSITPITTEAYYVVGGVQGWSDKNKICLFAPEAESDVYSYTTKWTGAWDLKIWDAANFGNWDKAFGCAVDGDNSPSGDLIGTGAQAISAPSAEFYTLTIDMKNMKYTWTKLDNQAPTEYEHISLIGGFNGWGDDYELNQVTPHNWYAEFTQTESGELKLRANHDWGINWGYGDNAEWDVTAKMNNIGANGAGNIYVPAGTYDVYMNDITNVILFLAK